MRDRLLEWIDVGDREQRSELALQLGERFHRAEQLGFVRADGWVDHVRCEQCLTAHWAPVERIGASYRAYCYRTGKRVNIAPEAAAAVRPDPGALARALSRSLKAKGQLIERSKGRLWELGWVDVAGKSRALFFCRDISFAADLSIVCAHLDARGSKWPGIVLCAGSAPVGVTLKNGHAFRPLRECFGFSYDGITIDINLVESWAQGLRRPRANGSVRTERQEPEWLEPARRLWKELHKSGRLNRNASAMSRLVQAMLTRMKPPLQNPPELPTVYKYLLPRHRRHYPLKRRRS